MYDFSYKMQASSNYMRLFIRFFVQKWIIFTLGRDICAIFRIKRKLRDYMRLFIRFFVQKWIIFTLVRDICAIFHIKPLAVGMDTDTNVRDLLDR